MKLFKQVDHQDIDELRAELAELAPLTAKVKAEKQAETLAQRQEAAAQVEKLTKERDKALAELRAALAEKEVHYQDAKKALDKATNEMRAAKAELTGQAHRFESAIDRHRQALLESADRAIDEGIQFFRDRLDALRRPGVIEHIGRASKADVFSWTKRTEQESNRDAVLRSLSYCQKAIQTLEAMKLETAFDPDAVKKLKDAIPRTDVFETIKGTAALEKPKSLQPALEAAERKANALFKKLGMSPA